MLCPTQTTNTETDLQPSVTLQQSIVKSAHIALISIDKDRVVTSWNPAAERLLGHTAAEAIGKLTPDAWQDSESVQQLAATLTFKRYLHSDPFLSLALEKGEDIRELIFVQRTGGRILVRLTTTPIFDENREQIGFLFHATDISEFRRASHQLRELSRALENMMSGWARLDLNGKYVSVNRSYAETTGYSTSEMTGLAWQRIVHPEDIPAVTEAFENMVLTGRGEARARGLRRDNSIFHEEVFLAPAHDYLGKRVGSYCFMRDVTARVEAKRKAEELERQSLQEKEVLLKEIHHRVKNNLQVISCLLSLQSEAVKEASAIAALEDSERRVMAMALIHERLYGNHRMDRIDFGEYARALVEDLVSSCVSGSNIEPRFSLHPIDLTIEQAIPCGLILNELVINAVKYAYPSHTTGEVFIDLKQLADGKVSLSVSDTGKGLPSGFDWQGSKSLGLTIVNLLAKQIGGDLIIESRRPGSSFTIIFSKAN